MTDASVQGGMKVNQSEVHWFVNCVIFNVTVKLLVDGGESISMIDVKLFQKAPLTLRSSLKPINVSYVTTLNGCPVKCHGECDASLKFGNFVLRHMIVSDLDGCQGILGVDILNLGGGYLDLGGHIIPLDHSSFVSTLACRDPTLVLPEFLQSIVDYIEGLSVSQRKQIVDLVCDYQAVFADEKESLGRTFTIRHKMDTGAAKPSKQAPRHLPQAKREIIEAEIDRMLKQSIIEPSTSSWSSPVVLVEKKDGSPRFCVDFRKLSNVTVKDAYPLPNAEELIDELSGSQWFSTLDLASDYWQVELDPIDREKTAFTFHGKGLFHFKVMSFGLTNAPSTFQRLMETVLKGILWKICAVYVDDVIFYADKFQTAYNNLKIIFQRLCEAGLRLKPKKCRLFLAQLNF